MLYNHYTVAAMQKLLDYDARKFTIAEIQLKNSFPEWINRASSPELKAMLQQYAHFVQEHGQKIGIFLKRKK